jgi:hypothetical protein
MEETIDLHKCIEPEKFIEILDDCIQTLEDMREKVRQEIYYDEL